MKGEATFLFSLTWWCINIKTLRPRERRNFWTRIIAKAFCCPISRRWCRRCWDSSEQNIAYLYYCLCSSQTQFRAKLRTGCLQLKSNEKGGVSVGCLTSDMSGGIVFRQSCERGSKLHARFFGCRSDTQTAREWWSRTSGSRTKASTSTRLSQNYQ